MKVTYFVELLSSWCHWAEPAWADLQSRYRERVNFAWKIALMKPADFPATREQCDWYYRRSGTIARSPYRLDSGWLEPDLHGDYRAPNLVAEAGRDFGATDDRLRMALTHAALREGRPIGQWPIATAIGAETLGVSAAELLRHATSPEIAARVADSTALFHAHQLSQRPAFLLENDIGDKVVLSGLWVAAPLIAAIDTMLADASAYATHRAHFGPPPA